MTGIVSRRCVHCHRMLPNEEFPTVRYVQDRKGKKRRIFDSYCRECAAKVPMSKRKQMGDA